MNFSKNNDPIEIAKEVLKTEADSIYTLMNQPDDDFRKAINLIMQQSGQVLVLGVGKSEYIGKKLLLRWQAEGNPPFLSIHRGYTWRRGNDGSGRYVFLNFS